MKRYHRPAAFLFGPDARRAIAEGLAGALGGSAFIAFTQIEISGRTAGHVSRAFEAFSPGRIPPLSEARQPVCGLSLDHPRLMGIVNVTPDSFSDGGLLPNAETAIAHGMTLAEEGADILDIGGESTRPGSHPTPPEEEWSRIGPVVSALAKAGLLVSVDTRKAEIMRRAVDSGARMINDVSALGFDCLSAATVAALGTPVTLMHAKGDPKTMQANPTYDDVTLDVFDMLEARLAACEGEGISRGKLLIDPGIGFGKTLRHNLELLHNLALFHALGVGIVVGLSRKSTIGTLTGEREPRNRVMGSVGGAIHAALTGAHILRVHDVKATRQALSVVLATADPERSP
ncbi:MAG: dihydropteroate synthase [Hyphomicrobiales bacterium]